MLRKECIGWTGCILVAILLVQNIDGDAQKSQQEPISIDTKDKEPLSPNINRSVANGTDSIIIDAEGESISVEAAKFEIEEPSTSRSIVEFYSQ